MNDTPADYRKNHLYRRTGKSLYMARVHLKGNLRCPWHNQTSVREGIWREWDRLGPALLGADEYGAANKKKTQYNNCLQYKLSACETDHSTMAKKCLLCRNFVTGTVRWHCFKNWVEICENIIEKSLRVLSLKAWLLET